MEKKKYKMKATTDFGTWLKKGEVVEQTEHWVLFACNKGYAKLLKGEARRLRGISLLEKYGLPPFRSSYTRKQVIELINKLEDKKCRKSKKVVK